ncbi:MAG: metallophosphoesterase [bacterium]|nr:metallophosphoesterase [bacterium]
MRIVLVGDLQRTGLVETWRESNHVGRLELVSQIKDERPHAAILLGDMVFWGSSHEDWEYFDGVTKPIHDMGIPVFPVLGNHEYYGSNAASFAELKSRFSALDTSTWYVNVLDSIAFVMLNTNIEELSERELRTQRNWYLKMMKNLEVDSAIVAIVVCGHHPPYTNSVVVSGDVTLNKHFVPTFLKSKKGTFWFSGHAHTYERFVVGKKQFIVSGGGGGPRQLVRLPRATEEGAGAEFVDEYKGPALRSMHFVVMQRKQSIVTCIMRPIASDRTDEDATYIDVSPKQTLTNKD